MYKNLVFDEFNVDQPRGHFAYIEQDIPDLIDQHENVTVGFASRGTGIVKQPTCPKLQTDPLKIKYSFGSGMLTSSTRLTTALHVVDNKSAGIEILFGTGKGNGHFDGDYVADDIAIPGLDYNSDYRSNIIEEEPFLAMRLFQLGLGKWAEKNNASSTTIRNKLRKWTFDYDVVPGGTLFMGQGFANLSNYSITGEDIVVLEAIGPVSEDGAIESAFFGVGNAKVPSGPFLIDRPGVFFDSFQVGQWEGLDIATPLWMEHVNKWPGRKNISSPIARLISRPGRVFSGPTSRQISNECGPNPHMLTGLVPTTVDGTAGSSGGGIIAPNIHEQVEDDAFFRQSMLTIGVFNGSHQDQAIYGDDSWDSAGPIALPDVSSINYFTGISDPSIPSRDTPKMPNTGGAPKACEEGQEEKCIPCKRFNGDNKCIEIKYVPSAIPVGSGNLPIDPRDVPEDDLSSSRERIGDRRVNCGFTSQGSPYPIGGREEFFPGMLVGLMGGSNGKFGKEDYVRDLYAICAPISLSSFTENWRFLYTKGSILPRNISGIQNRRVWSNLNTMMNETYSVNNNQPEKGHTFRPVPMKFCPPKYLLDGLDFVVEKKGITGVKALHCRKPTANLPTPVAGPSELLVYLDASEQGIDGYTIFGKEYTLDQRIGNVNLTGLTPQGTDVPFRCERGGFLGGLEMSHDANGVLDKFHPYCIPFNL